VDALEPRLTLKKEATLKTQARADNVCSSLNGWKQFVFGLSSTIVIVGMHWKAPKYCARSGAEGEICCRQIVNTDQSPSSSFNDSNTPLDLLIDLRE
jgi:hypothetical protein